MFHRGTSQRPHLLDQGGRADDSQLQEVPHHRDTAGSTVQSPDDADHCQAEAPGFRDLQVCGEEFSRRDGRHYSTLR